MTNHRSEAELNDYADGVLSSVAVDEVERHLEICGECQDRVEAVRLLTARLAAIPRAAEPARDLWPEIAARADEEPGCDALDEAEDEDAVPGVIPFRPRRAPAPDPSVWLWRAAAAVVLFAAGGGAGWALKPRSLTQVVPPTVVLNETPPSDPVEAAADVKSTGDAYVAAVRHFTSLTDRASSDEVTATRGVVLTTIQGAAGALATLSPNDAPMNQIVRAVSNELERAPSGDPVTTAPRHEAVPGEQFY